MQCAKYIACNEYGCGKKFRADKDLFIANTYLIYVQFKFCTEILVELHNCNQKDFNKIICKKMGWLYNK